MQELIIQNTNFILSKENFTSEEFKNNILNKINELEKTYIDFSTHEGVEDYKKLKKQANETVKILKEFCEPLEEEGKKIGKIRSEITTRLSTGKDNMIDKIGANYIIAENRFKTLDGEFMLDTDSIDILQANFNKLEELKSFNWLVFKEMATQKIDTLQGRIFIKKLKLKEQEKIKLEEQEKIKKEQEEILKAKLKKEIEEENNKKTIATEEVKMVEKEIKKEIIDNKTYTYQLTITVDLQQKEELKHFLKLKNIKFEVK